MKPLPEDTGTLVPSHDHADTGTLVSAMLDLGTMVINSDTDNEATMKSWCTFNKKKKFVKYKVSQSTRVTITYITCFRT